MNNVVYQITSPNLPNTFYVGGSTNLKERWNLHKRCAFGKCTSTTIILAGSAFIEAIEIVQPSDRPISDDLEDAETRHILRLRAMGMTVVNKYLPGEGRRLGRDYGKQHMAHECQYCERVVIHRNITPHQRTKRCKAFQAMPPLVVLHA
jgi:hypothetical protein